MLVWLIKDSEPLPIQAGDRPMRIGMIAQALERRGHSVTWWSSTFRHGTKKLLFNSDQEIVINPRLRLNLIHAGAYTKNISLKRYKHHRKVAKRFYEGLAKQPPPDVIVCAFPLIDLAHRAVEYARNRSIPIVVDVQDLWPDTFLDEVPRVARSLARLALVGDFRKTEQVLIGADGITAISRGCLNWALRYAKREMTERDQVFHAAFPALQSDDVVWSERLEKLRRRVAGKVVFTFLGSFGNSYQLELLCEAATCLQSKGLDTFHLLLAGAGEKYDAVTRAAKRLPNVTVTGWLDNEEVKGVLLLSHVGLAPCRMVMDAMPNKVAEYAAAGLPMISSLEGEVEQLLMQYDAGWSYRCGDLKTLMSHLVKLTQDRATRERQGLNVRRLFNREFQAETMFEDYARHVEGIANYREGALPNQTRA